MVYAQTRISPVERDTLNFLGDKIATRLPDLVIGKKKRKKKKWTCRIVDFAALVDHSVKIKENEKRDKYLDLARELKKVWNMKVTVIPIVTGPLGTVSKGLIEGKEGLEIRGRAETL